MSEDHLPNGKSRSRSYYPGKTSKPDPLSSSSKIVSRVCLKCRKPFRSSGLFICSVCTDENDNLNLSKLDVKGAISGGNLGNHGVRRGSDGS